MDFVMSGPRFQVNTIEGYENGTVAIHSGKLSYGLINHSATYNDTWNTSADINDAYITDLWNGRQGIAHIYWSPNTESYTLRGLQFSYALKTTTPDVYIIVSIYGGSTDYPYECIIHWARIGNYPVANSDVPQGTWLRVDLPIDEWVYPGNPSSTPVAHAVNTYYVSSTAGYLEYLRDTDSSVDSFSATSNCMRSSLSGNTYTIEVMFPGGYNAIRDVLSSRYIFGLLPLHMNGRKFASHGETILAGPSDVGCVAKVYSPAKGCLCLKSYLNGEIPILNE